MSLLVSSTWMFVVFVTTVAGVYATGMVLTRKRLSKVRGLDQDPAPTDADRVLREEPGNQGPSGGAGDDHGD